MIKGNKGEWSELYVLVKLLAEGKLHQSDINLNKDPHNVYEVINAYKGEINYELEFSRTDEIIVFKIDAKRKEQIGTFSINEFKRISNLLYEGIKNGKGRSFQIEALDDFLSKTSIKKIKADPKVKADLKLKIYDYRIAKETDLGFSIKSLIGGRSTLFNASAGNNFIYSSPTKMKESISAFNKRTYKTPKPRGSKIAYRLSELKETSVDLKFKEIQSEQLWQNLKMVDGDLPEIIGWALYYRWTENESSLKKIAEILEIRDPLNYYKGKSKIQKMYEYKLKRFLTEAAMGMTSEKVWLGEYESFGGVIVAKEDGDVLCFHIYDFNLFRNYLLNNTEFEQASTGEDEYNPGTPRTTEETKKYFYGWLYEEYGELLFKINLQIRFIKAKKSIT